MDSEWQELKRLMADLPEPRRQLFLTLYAQRRRDPQWALIFSIGGGLFGFDRFYLGQIGLGAAKLLLCWLTLGIWWIVDIFLIRRKCFEVNTQIARTIHDEVKIITEFN